MGEKTSCITDRKISYEGIFSIREVCSAVDTFFSKRGYARTVKSQTETVKPKGKFIMLKLGFTRTINDYAQYQIDIGFQFENITVVEIVKDGHKTKMNKGMARIGVDSWVVTDYEKSWEIRPTLYFLRTLANKFFFKNLHDTWVADVKKDVGDLVEEIQSTLNLQVIER